MNVSLPTFKEASFWQPKMFDCKIILRRLPETGYVDVVYSDLSPVKYEKIKCYNRILNLAIRSYLDYYHTDLDSYTSALAYAPSCASFMITKSALF